MSFDPSSHAGRSTPLPQPGSLEYINRPNPVEPSTLSHGSLDGSARELDRTTNEQLHPFLLGNRLRQRRDIAPDAARLARQSGHQSSGVSIAAVLNNDQDSSPLREHTPHRREADLFTLPKLPVKRGTKRHRVPPVLQGLHQPPPDAGILPSISTEESQVFLNASRTSNVVLNPSPRKEASPTVTAPTNIEVSSEVPKGTQDKRSSQRNRWTDQETEDLLNGVTKFGIGSWKKILLCPDYHFHKRTAVDLKDRFRVCRPEAYGGPRKPKAAKKPKFTEDAVVMESTNTAEVEPEEPVDVAQPTQTDENKSLWKARRRPRRNFTAEEDEALLKGFSEQGASWVSILKQDIFQANHRTPTDLRDRFRTKFPEKYAEAGLASRPSVPKPAARTQATREEQSRAITPTPVPQSVVPAVQTQAPTERTERITPRQPYNLPLPSFGDDSLSTFGLPEDDEDALPVVLDRSIVDWANNTVPPSTRLPQISDTTVFPGIDPLVTLKLPKPGFF